MGRPWVKVIYGTSQEPAVQKPNYFTIWEDLWRYGLEQPTRFNLDREARVPWAREYFEAPENGTPRVWPLSVIITREIQIQAAYWEQSWRK